jgi:diaminopimelate epimerase
MVRPPTAVRLSKAQAYGNDFLLMAASAAAGIEDLADLARRACDRHRGIGADGLMLLDETTGGAATRLFNADGSDAELSGNGSRAVAAWLAEARGLRPGATLTIDTAAGPRPHELLEVVGHRYTLRADMGVPTDVRRERIILDTGPIDAVVLNMGNPQCVVLGPATEERLHAIGPRLAAHPLFPNGTNVELASVETPHRVRILIWERGVGPTEASGTGACAAAVAAATAGGSQRSVEVVSPGGTQRVEWTDEAVWLTGWAELVASVEWLLPP